MKRLTAAAAVLILFCGILFPAGAESFTVAVSFQPLYIFALNLLRGTDVSLVQLSSDTAGCLHDYQLLPGDLIRLRDADLLLINGAGMESFLPKIAEVYPELPVIDCSEGIELLPGESEDEPNSHIWLSPLNAVRMVRNMADALIAADESRAEIYENNAQAYTATLTALDEQLHRTLDSLPRREILTFHEAFPYFARDYGLTVLAVITPEAEESVSPRRLAELTKLVKDHGLPPLFIEAQYSSDAAEALAAETGAGIWELNTLVTGPKSLTAYEDALTENARILSEALGN